MGQQRNSMQIKEQVKTPEEELSEMRMSNLPAKRSQGNDCKDVHRPQKNGGTEWEVFNEELEKYKEHPNRDEEHNNWNEKCTRRNQ